MNENGEVQKLKDGTWIKLKPYMSANRVVVKMQTPEKKKVCVPLVWLVADAFMGGRRKGFDIVHKNGSKFDCSVYNLRFATKRESGMISCGNRRKAVEKIDRDGNVVALYRSATEAAKANYIAKNAVGQRCRNELVDPFALTGFSFRYEKGVRGAK